MKRFLNVVYKGISARINVTEMQGLSQLQKEIKSIFGDDFPGSPSQIQFYDREGNQVDDLDDIPGEYFNKRKEGGLELVICPGSTLPSKAYLINGNNSFIAQEFQPFQKQRMEISDLTSQFKSFANCQIVANCIIQEPNRDFFPYPQDKIQKLYVRKCYQDVFDLLMEQIKIGNESFAISGTPGIGKSLFFMYILYRLVKDFSMKTLPLKPNRILYHSGGDYTCFNLETQPAVETIRGKGSGSKTRHTVYY
jgi:hypothetical protein